MIKSTAIRWILDLVVLLMLAYAGWSFKQFLELKENDIVHRTRLEQVAGAVGSLDDTLKTLNSTIRNQGTRVETLFLMGTFRTDPWSGKMMLAYHNAWIDWVKQIDPNFNMEDGPDVYEIQRRYASELVPSELQEVMRKQL